MKIRFNLLPPRQKKHLKIQKVFRTVIEQEIHIVFLFLFLVLSLFAMYFILNTRTTIMQDIKMRIIEKEQYKEIESMHGNFADIHKTMNSVDELIKGRTRWSRLLIILSENIGQQINVDSMVVSGDKLIIEAIAETRGDVILLKASLRDIVINDVQCFEEIVVPESQLATPVDVVFTMTLKINSSCLK